jgi:hypothetical protein
MRRTISPSARKNRPIMLYYLQWQRAIQSPWRFAKLHSSLIGSLGGAIHNQPHVR